jgi:transposase InsO family protein
MPITSIRGHTHYLLVIDVATRYIFLRALTDKAKHTVASVLFQLYCDFGFPKVLQSDNGTEFINNVMTEVKSLCRIDGRTINPYHHRANGIAERAIRTTSEALFKVIRQHDRHWDTFLPYIHIA